MMTASLPRTRFNAPQLSPEANWLPPLSAITDVVNLNGKPVPCVSVVDGRNQWIATMIPVQFHDLAILFAASPELLLLAKRCYAVLEKLGDSDEVRELRNAIHHELWGEARALQKSAKL